MGKKVSTEMRKLAESQIRKMQKEISFDTKDYPIELLVSNFREGDFYIPEYQRKFIWDNKTRIRFIESVLLGLPIPFMFFSDNDDGRNEIIDGAQRVSTLEEFMNNDLVLKDLEKLTDLNGFSFNDLPDFFQRKFRKKTLRIIVLSEETTLEVKQDIFNRINTGGKKAMPSEIRRGSYVGPLMNFIKNLAKDELFNELCPISKIMQKRYEGEELVIRFFAYLDDYNNFNQRVEEFLNKFVAKYKDDFNEPQFKEEFFNMLHFVDYHFPYGFRKTKTAKSTPRVRFEAISVGVALALREDPNLIPKSMDWLDSPEFKKHTTTHSSNNLARVKGRIEYVKDQLMRG